jgi:hypothetical protein
VDVAAKLPFLIFIVILISPLQVKSQEFQGEIKKKIMIKTETKTHPGTARLPTRDSWLTLRAGD